MIVAGGESFTTAQARLIGMARTRDLIRVIAINDAIYPCWYADILWACDARWWKFHGTFPAFQGRRLSIEDSGFPEVERVKCSGENGFDPVPGSIRSGGNGGYQSLHYAAHLGIKKAILVGFDMGGGHWFGPHPRVVRKTEPTWARLIEKFDGLAGELRKRKITVVNAAPRSALKAFPSVDLASELEKLGE